MGQVGKKPPFVSLPAVSLSPVAVSPAAIYAAKTPKATQVQENSDPIFATGSPVAPVVMAALQNSCHDIPTLQASPGISVVWKLGGKAWASWRHFNRCVSPIHYGPVPHCRLNSPPQHPPSW
jgi:hypothetical protein